jgi:hypothetical protein
MVVEELLFSSNKLPQGVLRHFDEIVTNMPHLFSDRDKLRDRQQC